jgi:hypothetical protein
MLMLEGRDPLTDECRVLTVRIGGESTIATLWSGTLADAHLTKRMGDIVLSPRDIAELKMNL